MPRGRPKKTVDEKKTSLYDLSTIFQKLWKDDRSAKKSILFAAFLLFSVILVSIGLVFGYLFYFIRNILEGKEYKLPDWPLNNGKKLTDMYIRGWKLFLVFLPYLLLNLLFFIGFIKTVLFPIPIIFCVFTIITLPFLTIKYVEYEDYKKLFDFEDIIKYIGKNIVDIIVLIIFTIGIFVVACFGVVLLVFVAFTLTWALFVTTFQWTMLYKKYKK